MYTLMLYSLKVGACLAVFYLFFKLLLSRETFHRLNRIVVLAAMVLSFVLPLCVITVYRELPAMPELPVTEEAGYAPSAEPESQPFPWDKAATAAFLAGAAAALLWTLGSVCGVLHMIRRGHRERLGDGSVLVRTDQPVVPFSWYRYIVMSEKDLAENGEAIVLHEKAHLRLRHSFDLLVTDLAGCLQWFNPAMWLLRRELRAIHEYEADEAVLDSGVDARQYQLLLIRKAAGGRWYSVANSFNHSKLKNRITMMLRKRSSRWAGAKVLFLLPLTGLALGAFARTAYVFPDDKGKKENVSIRIEGANFYSSDGKSGKSLFVVDGLEVASIDTLSPDRIASVTVLKDASAEALYGEKGRNGVVVVSTKDAAGGARDYSVDAEDGSVKVVVRGSGKMSDVRVSGSSTVPADKAGIDAEGIAIPIRKSDRVSGRVRFLILGPVNTLWDEVTRRHRTWFRHTKWSSTAVPLLAHVSSILVERFEMKVHSDNGLVNNTGDNDLIYMSDTRESFVHVKDDLEMKINSALTAAECQALGVTAGVTMSTPVNTLTGEALLTIHDHSRGASAKPEQLYVDSYYREWHAPRVLMTQKLADTDGGIVSLFAHYRHPAMGRTFFVQSVSRNLEDGYAEMNLKEIEHD